MTLIFGDIVVVDGENIGVICKCWESNKGKWYEVYVRMYNQIKEYKEGEVKRYLVRHKYLSEEEKEYQKIGEAL